MRIQNNKNGPIGFGGDVHLTLEPGMNENVDASLWAACKKRKAGKYYVDAKILVEMEDSAPKSKPAAEKQKGK